MVPTANVQVSKDDYLKYDKYMTYAPKSNKTVPSENLSLLSKKICKNVAKIRKNNVVRPVNLVRPVNKVLPKKTKLESGHLLNHDVMETLDHMMNTTHEQVTENDSASNGVRSIKSVVLKRRHPEELQNTSSSNKFNSKQVKNVSSPQANTSEKIINPKKQSKLNTGLKQFDKEAENVLRHNILSNFSRTLNNKQALPAHFDKVMLELVNVLFHANEDKEDQHSSRTKKKRINDVYKTKKKGDKKTVTKHKHSSKTKKSTFKSKNDSRVRSVSVVGAKKGLTIFDTDNISEPSGSAKSSSFIYNGKKISKNASRHKTDSKQNSNHTQPQFTPFCTFPSEDKDQRKETDESFEVSIELQTIINHITNAKENEATASMGCEKNESLYMFQNLLHMIRNNQFPECSNSRAASAQNKAEKASQIDLQYSSMTETEYYDVEEMSDISDSFRKYENEQSMASKKKGMLTTTNTTKESMTKIEDLHSCSDYSEYEEALDKIEIVSNNSTKYEITLNALKESYEAAKYITEKNTITTAQDNYDTPLHNIECKTSQELKATSNMELKNYFNHKLESLSNKFKDKTQQMVEDDQFIKNVFNSIHTENTLNESKYENQIAHDVSPECKSCQYDDMLLMFEQTKSTDAIGKDRDIKSNSFRSAKAMPPNSTDNVKMDINSSSSKTTDISSVIVPVRSNYDDDLQLKILEAYESKNHSIRRDAIFSDASACFYNGDDTEIEFPADYDDSSDDSNGDDDQLDDLTDEQDNPVLMNYLDLIDSPKENNTPITDISNLENSEILNHIFGEPNKYFLQSPQTISQLKSYLEKEEQISTSFETCYDASERCGTKGGEYDNDNKKSTLYEIDLLKQKSVKTNDKYNEKHQNTTEQFEIDFAAKELCLRNFEEVLSSALENSSADIQQDETEVILLSENIFIEPINSDISFSNADIHRGMFEIVNQANCEDNDRNYNEIYSKVELIDLNQLQDQNIDCNNSTESINEIISLEVVSSNSISNKSSEIINDEQITIEPVNPIASVKVETHPIKISSKNLEIPQEHIAVLKESVQILNDFVKMPLEPIIDEDENCKKLQENAIEILKESAKPEPEPIEIQASNIELKKQSRTQQSVLNDEVDKAINESDSDCPTTVFSLTRIKEVPEIEINDCDPILEEAQELLNKISTETETNKPKAERGSKFEITFNEMDDNILIEIGQLDSSREGSSISTLEGRLSNCSSKNNLNSINNQYPKFKVSSNFNSFNESINFTTDNKTSISDKSLKTSYVKKDVSTDKSDCFDGIVGDGDKYFPNADAIGLTDEQFASTSILGQRKSSSNVCRIVPSNCSTKTVVHRSDCLYANVATNANLVEPEDYNHTTSSDHQISGEDLLYAVLKKKRKRNVYTTTSNIQKKILSGKPNAIFRDLLLFLVYAAVFTIVFGALRLSPPLCLL